MTEPSDRLVRRREMLQRVGLSYTTVKLLVSSGEFPEPVILTPNAAHAKIAWVSREIDQWLASRPRRAMRPPSNASASRPLPAPVTVPDPAGDRFGHVTKPHTAARPRLLTAAEKRRLVQAKVHPAEGGGTA
jgi:predicted DNA-binding transcriptional regulator AlpA